MALSAKKVPDPWETRSAVKVPPQTQTEAQTPEDPQCFSDAAVEPDESNGAPVSHHLHHTSTQKGSSYTKRILFSVQRF